MLKIRIQLRLYVLCGVAAVAGAGPQEAGPEKGPEGRTVTIREAQVRTFDLISKDRTTWQKAGDHGSRRLDIGALASAGDANGDHVPDIAVGLVSNHENGFYRHRLIWVLSGKDGSLLHEIDGLTHYDNPTLFGRELANGGDVDADGFDDLLVGMCVGSGFVDVDYPNAARVYSGRMGRMLAQKSRNRDCNDLFGYAVCGLGDIDRDGWGEWCVGSPNESCLEESGRVYVYSGKTGEELFQLEASANGLKGNYGYDVAPAGDVNGDGTPDIWVLAAPSAGYLACISGADAKLLNVFRVQGELTELWYPLSYAGDVDGDGRGDVLVKGIIGGRDDGQRCVLVISGADGSLVHRYEHPDADRKPTSFGDFSMSCGDLDEDGFSEIAITGFIPAHGKVLFVFSGRDKSLLMTIVDGDSKYGLGTLGSYGQSVLATKGSYPQTQIVILTPRLE